MNTLLVLYSLIWCNVWLLLTNFIYVLIIIYMGENMHADFNCWFSTKWFQSTKTSKHNQSTGNGVGAVQGVHNTIRAVRSAIQWFRFQTARMLHTVETRFGPLDCRTNGSDGAQHDTISTQHPKAN